MKKVVIVRVEPHVKDKLVKLCQEDGVTISSCVEEMIEAYVEEC